MTGIRNETSRIQQIYWEIPKPYLESFQTFKPLSVNPTKWSNTQAISRQIASELFEFV